MASWYPEHIRQKRYDLQSKRIEDRGWKNAPVPLTPQISYFRNHRRPKYGTYYDTYMSFSKVKPLFDPRKSKCNRQLPQEIHENIFRQEEKWVIPATVNMSYGRPALKFYDFLEVGTRRLNMMIDTYRPSGIWPVVERSPDAFLI